MTVKVTFIGSGDAFGAGGRFNTCILVDAPDQRIAIDFGASSLVALNQLDIDHASIDAVVLTHLHGDHCGGLPFMLMDGMLGAKRTKPLTIVGPEGTEAHLGGVCEALFPGMHVMSPKFHLTYAEMPVMKKTEFNGFAVTSYPAMHTGTTNPTSIRVEVGGKVVSYTGDSEWTRHMPDLARDADLFVLASKIAADGDRDGLPNVLMEAQSQGLACLASDVAGIPELISNGETGVLAPPGNTQALSDGLKRLIGSPQDRQRFGSAGANRLGQRFSFDGGIARLAAKFGLPKAAPQPQAAE